MLSLTMVIGAGLLWLGLLFGVALYGERHPGILNRRWALVYALSLAIHCTSWTFYGTVSQASGSGWWLPPTFVGAIGLYVLGGGLMQRLVQLTRKHNASSLADLIGARLGRHSGLAALVTAVMLMAIIPYIALQLKAVTMSFSVVVHGGTDNPQPWQDSALYVALAMAVFAMMFGTRRASTMLHNRGLILAIAFESAFKLVAMLVIAALVLPAWLQVDPPAAGNVAADTSGFPTLILLGALAMFAMPHQFHVAVTECRDADQVRTGRWLFPLYLILIALPILPLARLGDALLGPQGVSPDLYVLALPMLEGHAGGTLLAFLGGLSAATGMVVVATLALSLMVANHFVAPLHVLSGWGRGEQGDLRGAVLTQRRVAILIIVLLAWAYSRLLTGSNTLADIGATSFSALAGLAPATLAAAYRPRLGARAVSAGIVAGTLAWLYVLLPSIFDQPPAWMLEGPRGWHWLAPAQLLGLGQWSSMARAVTLNLAVNAATVLLVAQSRWGQPRLGVSKNGVGRHQLRALATRFLPPERVNELFASPQQGRADKKLLAAVEHELAGVIGASSAHLLLEVVHQRRQADLDEVATIVDEAAQDLRFNQQVLQAALENMSQGICVVDGQQRVVAWNNPYAELFNYPSGLLRIGCPIADLMHHNIRLGLIGKVNADAAVQRRLEHMRRGTRHQSERMLHGAVIEIRGNPMPGGGYVATFTDVTRFRQAEAALKRINETLEQRVEARTHELALATRAAEQANEAKGYFLAAVSHDLLQPLHAAQLFSQTLQEALQAQKKIRVAGHLINALDVTEALLVSLLDIASLESGEIEHRPRTFVLNEVLEPLEVEFSALAKAQGVTLKFAPTRAWTRSDPQLLRRILQNFLANALRHAGGGRVLLAVRNSGPNLRIEVRDSGPGISAAEQKMIFQQFRRGKQASGQGLGLGLAIAERMAQLLGHPLGLRSQPGRGSVFFVLVPSVKPEQGTPRPKTDDRRELPLAPGRVLVIDNDHDARQALTGLLESWGWQVHARAGMIETEELPWPPDAAILDYHLDEGLTGLDVLCRLRQHNTDIPTAIVTADRDPGLREALQAADVVVLYKPLKPLALRRWLRRVVDTDTLA